MRQFVPEKEPATQVVKNIRRATRRHFSAEDKIRIVLEGLRGDDYRRAVSPRGDRAEPVLSLVKKTSWRLARSAWLAIRLGPPPRTRSTICVARPWRSRRWLPI